MPFEITNQGAYFLARLFGVLTSQDLERFAEEAEVVENSLPVAMNRVTDITSVEAFDIDYFDVLALAARRRVRLFSKPVKSALIAQQPIEIGFSRMFQSLNDNPQIEVRVLKTLDQAIDWFAEEQPGPPLSTDPRAGLA